MSSLDSPDLDLRQALIADRFEHTCEWIYQHESFSSWLKQDDGVFWIYGKPGSGKSTVMKLIYTDSRTQQYSHSFERSICHISAGFFFNYRGTVIQKSFEGLMRSILRQIIKQLEKSATLALLDDLLQSPIWTQKSHDPWLLTQMEEFLRAILNQKRVELRVWFFFDALDEFDGPPDYISRFVKYLANRPPGSLTHVKVCFSSRPWEEFFAGFSSSPNLAVEDFTKEDIRYYCAASLSNTLAGNHLAFVPRLVDEIVLRASGVFLWASLVLKELATACCNGQMPSLADLLGLLKSVPVELSKFYHFMIQRIPGTLRWKTYALLEAVVRSRSQEEVGVNYLWKTTMISNCPNYESALQALKPVNRCTRRPRDSEEIRRRDILIWGGGLVSAQSSTGVQLMHQTVYEFVTKLDFKDKLLESFSQPTHENGHSFHFKSALTFHLADLLLPTISKRDLRASLSSNREGHNISKRDLRASVSSNREGHNISKPGVRASFNQGAEAEETTGRSCQLFYDSVPVHNLNNLGIKLLGCLEAGDICSWKLIPRGLDSWSHTAFAVLFQLRLYLHNSTLLGLDYFGATAASENLLRLVVMMLNSGIAHDNHRVLATTKLLLENGLNKTALRSLFPYVLEPELPQRGFIDHTATSLQAFEELAILFLEHETGCSSQILRPGVVLDPEVPLYWVKPIHMANPLVTSWLLQHGVDPNELDSGERTPIDWYLSIHSYRRRDKTSKTPTDRARLWTNDLLYQCTSILLQHGAKARLASDESWSDFLEALRTDGHDVSEFPELVPRILIQNEAAPSFSSLGTPLAAQGELPARATLWKPKSSLSHAVKRIFSMRRSGDQS